MMKITVAILILIYSISSFANVDLESKIKMDRCNDRCEERGEMMWYEQAQKTAQQLEDTKRNAIAGQVEALDQKIVKECQAKLDELYKVDVVIVESRYQKDSETEIIEYPETISCGRTQEEVQSHYDSYHSRFVKNLDDVLLPLKSEAEEQLTNVERGAVSNLLKITEAAQAAYKASVGSLQESYQTIASECKTKYTDIMNEYCYFKEVVIKPSDETVAYDKTSEAFDNAGSDAEAPLKHVYIPAEQRVVGVADVIVEVAQEQRAPLTLSDQNQARITSEYSVAASYTMGYINLSNQIVQDTEAQIVALRQAYTTLNPNECGSGGVTSGFGGAPSSEDCAAAPASTVASGEPNPTAGDVRPVANSNPNPRSRSGESTSGGNPASPNGGLTAQQTMDQANSVAYGGAPGAAPGIGSSGGAMGGIGSVSGALGSLQSILGKTGSGGGITSFGGVPGGAPKGLYRAGVYGGRVKASADSYKSSFDSFKKTPRSSSQPSVDANRQGFNGGGGSLYGGQQANIGTGQGAAAGMKSGGSSSGKAGAASDRRIPSKRPSDKTMFGKRSASSGGQGFFGSMISKAKNLSGLTSNAQLAEDNQPTRVFDASKYKPSAQAEANAYARATGRKIASNVSTPSEYVEWPKDISRDKKSNIFSKVKLAYRLIGVD